MFRMFARRRSQVLCEVGVDKILFGLSLPSDSVVHDIKADIKIAETQNINHANATMYGLEMYILPVEDPDSGQGFQFMWDALVPKDTDVQAIDLDTQTADTTPFFEPGEADWSQVLDVGLRPEKLYGRYKMLTLNNSIFTFQDNQIPFSVVYRAGDNVGLRVRRRLRVRQPSVLVCAIASPALDDTTTNVEAMLNENEWARVKYARQTLELALMDLIGLQSVAGEPWEEATDLLQKHLEPDIFEETSGAFVSGQFSVYVDAMIDHSVVGDMAVKALSTGR